MNEHDEGDLQTHHSTNRDPIQQGERNLGQLTKIDLFTFYFVDDVLMGTNPDKITDYISTEKYHQHNPGVKDGITGLSEALTALAETGMPMTNGKFNFQ